MIQTFLENASSNQGTLTTSLSPPPHSRYNSLSLEIIDLITETSGRHTQRGLLRRNNDERPPSRVNSQPNVVCIDDDIVEIIAACIVMHARAAAQDGYVPSQEYAIFTKEMTQSHYDVVSSSFQFML